MNFSFEYKVDKANKLLVCDVVGKAKDVIDLRHLLKTMVKMAGKNQVKYVAVDVTQFSIDCSNVEVTQLMIDVQEEGWLTDIKIARIVNPEQNIQNVISGMAEKLSLPIKNFETRSGAMLWLLFDKVSER